jgi:DNA polymerase III delta subunit
MQIAGSGIDFTVGGKTYKFFPLTGKDIADFESWVKSRRIKEAQDALGVVSTADRIQMISQMINTSNPMHVQSEMSSMAGVQYLVYLSIRHGNKEVTEDEIADIINLNNVDELSTLLDSLMGGDPSGAKKEPDNPPARKPPAGQL